MLVLHQAGTLKEFPKPRQEVKVNFQVHTLAYLLPENETPVLFEYETGCTS